MPLILRSALVVLAGLGLSACSRAPAPTLAAAASSDVAATSAAVPAAPPPSTSADASTSFTYHAGIELPAGFGKRVRPRFKRCYVLARNEEPLLQGTITLVVTVDASGKVASIAPTQNTLGERIVPCMVLAVKETPLDTKGWEGV